MAIKINFHGVEITTSTVDEAVALARRLAQPDPPPTPAGSRGFVIQKGQVVETLGGTRYLRDAQTGRVTARDVTPTGQVARDVEAAQRAFRARAARQAAVGDIGRRAVGDPQVDPNGVRTTQFTLSGELEDDYTPPLDASAAAQVAFRFLTVIDEAANGADGEVIAKSLAVNHPKGIGSRTAWINAFLRKLGYEPDDVYATDRQASGRVWTSGPRLKEAIEAVVKEINLA